jgi:hypothetical protein
MFTNSIGLVIYPPMGQLPENQGQTPTTLDLSAVF